jgi:transcriptional regulator with XRE-family HTH domain
VQIPKLREMRELQGLTQQELADVSGVSVRSVAGYEGGAGVRPNTARKLAKALDVKVADLVGVAYPKARALSPLDTEAAAVALPDYEVVYEAEYSPDEWQVVWALATEMAQRVRPRYKDEGMQLVLFDSGEKMELRVQPTAPLSTRSRLKGRRSTKEPIGREAG